MPFYAVKPIGLILLAALAHPALAETAPPAEADIRHYIDAVRTRLGTDEAREALDAAPADDFYRWGKDMCGWLRRGFTQKQLIEGNMDAFFGPDLGPALVEAAVEVICPEFAAKRKE